MNKQQLLNVLLEAHIKCKKSHLLCVDVTLFKDEVKYLIDELQKEKNDE